MSDAGAFFVLKNRIKGRTSKPDQFPMHLAVSIVLNHLGTFQRRNGERLGTLTKSGGRGSVEDDERARHLRSAISDQTIAKIRDVKGFPLTSVVRLIINTTTLKY
ncbi:hypothetical protein TNCV_4044221 [Trichonephila clavipes]|nr:hypothetical protein TNCV_4044221 [Trichonephila clavipes]